MESVFVMLGTLNGGRFLSEQLASIAGQQGVSVDMLVSDDGSDDGTLQILAEHARLWRNGEVEIIGGPRSGYAENYRNLLLASSPGYSAYAFSDQDDIWDSDKLLRAVRWLKIQPENRPALYCGRTRIIDQSGNPIGTSPLFPRKPSFENALVQSIAGANTMVMNEAARNLLAASSRRTGFVSHDWWAYQMVTGAGGIVHYEKQPSISYRQHSTNIIGANSTWRARRTRLLLMAGGRFATWNSRNIAALEKCGDLLENDSLRLLEEFERMRCGTVWRRLILLRRSGIHRQTTLGQISLYLACLIKRF